MKKSTIAIIILSVLLFLSLSSLVLTVFIQRKSTNKLVIANDTKIIELKHDLKTRDAEIENLKNNPKITVEEKVVIQEKIIEADTELIENLSFRLDKTNEALKKRFIPKHSLSAFALVGLDNTLNYDLYVGVLYRRYFLEGRMFIGGGAFVKPRENIGGGISLEIGMTF
jgi:hypothetical protein